MLWLELSDLVSCTYTIILVQGPQWLVLKFIGKVTLAVSDVYNIMSACSLPGGRATFYTGFCNLNWQQTLIVHAHPLML